MVFRKIVENAGWIGLVQILNYLVPLFTLPVITRALGPHLYGSVATMTAYAGYAGLLVSYGFNFSGMRSVAQTRDRPQDMLREISAAIGAQFVLAAIAVVLFLIALFSLSPDRSYNLPAVIILTQVVSTCLIPQWVFLGLERMKDFTVVQLVSRVLAAICIVAWVRTADDLIFFLAVNSLSSIAILIGSFAILKKYDIRLHVPSTVEIADAMRGSTRLFFTNIATNLYTSTNIVIVSLVLGPAAAGEFALADRLRQVAMSVTAPVTSAIYPFMCRIAHREADPGEAWAKRFFIYGILGLSLAISIALFVAAPIIVRLLAGPAFEGAILLLRIMAFLPAIIAVSHIVGVQTMLPLGMDREVSWIVASAAVLGVCTMYASTAMFGVVGSASALVGIEIYVTVIHLLVLQRRTSIRTLFFSPATSNRS